MLSAHDDESKGKCHNRIDAAQKLIEKKNKNKNEINAQNS